MSRLTKAIAGRARAWARKRQGADPLSLTLSSRRIYIVPTGQGVAFGFLVFVMLLGAMNYNNSLGLAATFGLAGFGLVVMHHCHRGLAGLAIHCANAEPVFAGQHAQFLFTLENTNRFDRYDLAMFYEGEVVACIDLPALSRRTVALDVATEHRGVMHLERFSVRGRYPAGLFQAWAWIYCELSCVVFPAPAEDGRLPAPRASVAGSRHNLPPGDSDFAGLREYRRGDSPRHIAWKSYARNDVLRVKQFTGADEAPQWFEWQSTHGDTELRLSQLTRWIVDAERVHRPFGLTLPDVKFQPAADPRHVRECLTALARFG